MDGCTVVWAHGARTALDAHVRTAVDGLPGAARARQDELRALLEARLLALARGPIEVRDVDASARVVVPAWRACARVARSGSSVLVCLTWIFVVVLPILAIVLESAAHIARYLLGVDLVRTPLHVALLVVVPVVGVLGLRWLDQPATRLASRRHGALVGCALVVALVHGLAFLALSPLALLLAIGAGLGLFGLAPVLCGLVFPFLAGRLARRVPRGESRFAQGIAAGVVAGVSTYALLDPGLLVHAVSLGTTLLSAVHRS